jgi:antirestriction protein
MRVLIFQSEQDATAVAQQLYDSHTNDCELHLKRFDPPAVELAISLAGVEHPMELGASCLLPFPKHEREYSGAGPRIYVACLSAYNSGQLHGLWIDAAQDPEDIQADIEWMLSWSPASIFEACEEYAIHGFEGFGSLNLSEFSKIETISKTAQAIEEHGEAFSMFLAAFGQSMDEAINCFEDCFEGTFNDGEDFAYEYWENQGKIAALEDAGISPNCIDWAYVARDLECSGDFYFTKHTHNETYVFSRPE